MKTMIATSLVVAALGLAGLPAGAADPPRPGAKAGAAATPSAEAREAAALAFVRENHPELASLLEMLKAMKPEQYERAIAELAQVSRTLANLKKADERRYRAALDVWKARSRAELLAAELVGAPDGDRAGKLRAALEAQVAAELRQQRLEREIVVARLRRLDAEIERLESKRDTLVESRYQSLLKKAQRARRLEAGPAAPSRPAAVKGED